MTDLIDEARRLLDEAPAGTVSAWPRAAAVLARMQLEQAVGAYWSVRAPGMQHVRSMRAQLSCLVAYTHDAALRADLAYTWHALTRAMHHHTYELDPTREELASLLTTTQRLSSRLAVLTSSARQKATPASDPHL
jgi:hypothetical protein